MSSSNSIAAFLESVALARDPARVHGMVILHVPTALGTELVRVTVPGYLQERISSADCVTCLAANCRCPGPPFFASRFRN